MLLMKENAKYLIMKIEKLNSYKNKQQFSIENLYIDLSARKSPPVFVCF